MLKYENIADLVAAATKNGQKISQLVLADQAIQMEQTEEELYEKMAENFEVMCQAVVAGENPSLKSTSGLTGGEGFKMKEYAQKTAGGLSGSFMTKVMSRALAVSCCNAAMGRIVATPTAGSCGILPGCLVSLYEEKKYDKKRIN